MVKKNQSSRNTVKKIYSHLSIKRKKDLLILIILSLFSSLAELISIALLIPFISIFISPDTYLMNDSLKFFLNFLNIKNSDELLGAVSLSFIIIVILGTFIKIKFTYLSNKLSQNISSDFRIKIFEFFINQKFSYFIMNGSNKIMTALLMKSRSTAVVTVNVVNIFNSILVSSAILGFLIFFNPIITSIIILSTALYFYVIFKTQASKVFKMGKEVSEIQSFLVDKFTNAVGYLPEIIVYNLRNLYFKVFKDASKKNATLQSDIASISMYAKYYLESFIIVFVIIVLYFSDLNQNSIESNISYFAILAFAAQKSLPLINTIYKSSITLRSAEPLASDILDVLEDAKFNLRLINDNTKNNLKIHFKKIIKIDKIKYQYSKELPYILNNINFEINKGDKIVIKGETGTGKSTLINIILGLLNPTEGKITVDDIEINEDNQTNWQKNIAIVPQSIFLNDATILENIAISESTNEINLEKIKQSTKNAQIDSFIETLPSKYNEKIGERGVKLSGGQRQRLGIARALYKNANLIILDEPTNALDAKTEKKVMDAITNLDVTLIMISHSGTSLEYFDKVIDLNDFK